MGLSVEHLYDEGGIFLAREAAASGIGRMDLTRLRRGGVIHRVRHGAYTSAENWNVASSSARHLLLARAAFRTARVPVVLSHVTSVVSHTDGHWGLPLSEVDLSRLDGLAGRREAGVRQHRARPTVSHVEPWGDLLRTSAARAAWEAAIDLDFERSLIVINSLLHEGKTTVELLQHELVDMYQWPGTLGHELLLAECDARIESVGETRSYCAMRGRGLPSPIPQFEVRGPSGVLIARLDFALPELKVWVEFDGRVKYEKLLGPSDRASDVVLRERDRERQVEAITGWVCVRISWSDLTFPERIVARIREAAALAATRRTA
jgi:hypothetical protein